VAGGCGPGVGTRCYDATGDGGPGAVWLGAVDQVLRD
jgi:hypothetical protein